MVILFERHCSSDPTTVTSLLAKPLWDKFLEGATTQIVLEQKCDYITDEMFNQFGHGINPYALDYQSASTIMATLRPEATR
jgi:hypothetical protein